VLHICYGNSLLAEPGWEAYLRKGLTGLPMTEVFDIADLKPEELHAVIKTMQLSYYADINLSYFPLTL
jgi:hypothetical protein